MQYDLSILIPARNEMFVAKTVEDILLHSEGKTEVLVGLDGAPADPPIAPDPRVRIISLTESIGQRAMTNRLCELSEAKYIMKVDAHCSFDQGFDVKLMADMQDDWTVVPTMRNLHAFDWVCPDGHRRYQGPSGPCLEQGCGKETTRDVVWIGKMRPQSNSYCFDATPHFQYFGEFNKRSEGKGDLTESMSLQGSCFMCTRDKYWELKLSDEAFGSWGSQGIEVAVKTWLSGGRVMVNHKTWYAHMFRTQGGDFGFPYPQSGRQVDHAKRMAKEQFFNNQWKGGIRPLSWLVERFWPIKGWTDQDLANLKASERGELLPPPAMAPTPVAVEVADTASVAKSISSTPSKGIIFYTDNQLNLKIAHAVQGQLRKVSAERNIPIVSASLKPMSNMGLNVSLDLERGRLTMVKQILAALETSTADIVYFCEHDVLYSASHFDFTPERDDVFYYNQNFWKIRMTDGFAIHYDANQLSGLCCNRKFAIKEYKERVRVMAEKGWKSSMGYEPGTRGKRRGGFSDYRWECWKSPVPIVDIKHKGNLTMQRWRQDQFRDMENCSGWLESDVDRIEGWPNLRQTLGIN